MKKITRTVRRRRKEGRTDYKARLALLKSDKPRIIVRKTNQYIIGQLITSDVSQDRVLKSVTSKDLLGKGWPEKMKGSLKSLAACYLTGYLLGKTCEIKDGAIVDFGLHRNIKKSRLFAFIKGLVDSGADIPYDESSLPSDEEIRKNDKTKDLVDKVKGEIGNG